jgi:hypothetical protein
MAKSQKKSGREPRKPKQAPASSSASRVPGTLSLRLGK